MISIGNMLHGMELKETAMGRTLFDASKVLTEIRGPIRLGEQPLLNAVFLVPGSMGGPAFEGMKYGQYSKKDKAVVVQIAVAPEQVSTVESGLFVIDSLRKANRLAFQFFQSKGEVFALDDSEALIDKLAIRLNETGLDGE
jgi:hypothetical protein